MKRYMNERCCMGALLCSLALLTGCYPGDVSNTSPAETVSPEEVLQPENENLTLDLSIDDVSTDTFAAYNGLVAVKRPWDMDKVKALFSDEAEIVSEEKEEILSDAKNWYFLEFSNGSYINCSDGRISYTKSDSLAELFSSYAIEEMEMKTPSLCKKLYTTEELEDFSKTEALDELQTYIDALEIPVYGEPIVYVLDDDGVNNMIDQLGKDWKEKWNGHASGYRICYSLQTEGIPLVDSSIAVNGDKYPVSPSFLKAVVTKDDGVIDMNCRGIVEIDRSGAEEFTACSAATALNTVKSNLENGVVNKNTTLEKLYFGYALRFKDNGSYDMLPVWTVGECYETSSIGAEVHFVNAETGKEAT